MLKENTVTPDAGLEIDCGDAPFFYDSNLLDQIHDLSDRVTKMRQFGALSKDSLINIRKYFRIKNIYHSNAIEGNQLNLGETRQVVESGLTIAGKPLKDQAEAKNLNHALDYLETLASKTVTPITLNDIRQIHQLILKDIDNDNAGKFRRDEVTITGSNYATTPGAMVDAAMGDFAEWLGPASLDFSTDVIVTAAACHAWFVQIHPFADGNGRTARILMNLMLMRAGFPIAIITREDRNRYYEALEESQGSDLTSFITLVLECVSETLDEYETAVEEQREQMEWTLSIAERISTNEMPKIRNEYELWRSAMDLMVNHYQQVVDALDDSIPHIRVLLRNFGMLEFEKYLSLRSRQSAKKTWFFRLDFMRPDTDPVRYLHFFGYANRPMSEHARVSLHLSREEYTYRFVRLDEITRPNVPNLREIAYNPRDGAFVARRGSLCVEQRIEVIARGFFEDVVSKHFQN